MGLQPCTWKADGLSLGKLSVPAGQDRTDVHKEVIKMWTRPAWGREEARRRLMNWVTRDREVFMRQRSGQRAGVAGGKADCEQN